MQKNWAIAIGAIVALGVTAPAASAERFAAITSSNDLVLFNETGIFGQGANARSVNVTGLGAGEKLSGIDRRPATGELYGIVTSSSASRIVRFSFNRATAAAVATPNTVTPLVGQSVGFDFNPTVDRIRVTTDAGENRRYHPDTGARADAFDGSLFYGPGDVNEGRAPAVTGSAYTNSGVCQGTGGTTLLYDLDSRFDSLALQADPNGGRLQTIGRLDITLNRAVGFDISAGGRFFASNEGGLYEILPGGAGGEAGLGGGSAGPSTVLVSNPNADHLVGVKGLAAIGPNVSQGVGAPSLCS